MRLVDADWIHQNSDERFPGKKPYQEAWGLTMVDSAPTIDAVPVVRCRDCKHYQHYGKTSLLENGKNVKAGWCYRRIRFDEECRMPADGFCSYGQRKEDGHEQ